LKTLTITLQKKKKEKQEKKKSNSSHVIKEQNQPLLSTDLLCLSVVKVFTHNHLGFFSPLAGLSNREARLVFKISKTNCKCLFQTLKVWV